MIQNPPRSSTPLQPRPKAQATSSSSSFAATAARTSHATRAHLQANPKDTNRQSRDDTSDSATANFVRRTLCAHQIHGSNLAGVDKGRSTPKPIEELLPPLTSSNETDLQLYAFIAIIIKESVHSWYGKITPDHAFVDEVIQIIAHCTRSLEQRLRKVDLEALLLDEVPELVEAHIEGKKLRSPILTSHRSFDTTNTADSVGGSVSVGASPSPPLSIGFGALRTISSATPSSGAVSTPQSFGAFDNRRTAGKRGAMAPIVSSGRFGHNIADGRLGE